MLDVRDVKRPSPTFAEVISRAQEHLRLAYGGDIARMMITPGQFQASWLPGLPVFEAYLGAFFESELVGFVFAFTFAPDPKVGVIESLYVDPKNRRSGYGRQLVHEATKRLAHADMVEVHVIELEAIPFWQKILKMAPNKEDGLLKVITGQSWPAKGWRVRQDELQRLTAPTAGA
jgi:ribosomal protein S18 acetylase RimI-like enzyme